MCVGCQHTHTNCSDGYQLTEVVTTLCSTSSLYYLQVVTAEFAGKLNNGLHRGKINCHLFKTRKVKVKVTLEEATKAQRWSTGISSSLSLTSALDGGVGGQYHAQADLHPEKRIGTHCIGGCVGSVRVRKNLAPHRDSIPGPSTP